MPCIQGNLFIRDIPYPEDLSGEQVRPPKGLLSYPKGPEAGRSLQEEEDQEGTFLRARKRSSLRPGRMNESCGKRTLPDWHLSQPAQEEIRKEN